MSISVSNITKLYGTQKALDNVSFNVSTGEIVGLLGPNGAGKSTLMKILTCFLPPTEGNATVCNLDILKNNLEIRKKVGYLPENNPLYLEMYITEFLNFVASVHKISEKKKRIKEMIEITGLTLERRKKIGQLSKGYRQRVGLAQALIHNPEVLILDEPTSGLDPNQIVEIRNLISNIGKEKTILLSTHIMQEVEAICSRAIIIDHGKIIADDSISNLKHISSSNTIIVEFDNRVEKAKLMKIQGVAYCIETATNTWKIQPEKDVDVRKELLRFAVENNINVLSLEKERSSIEDIFRILTHANN
jgi:ABC-2 type transport system ATP-binding protein